MSLGGPIGRLPVPVSAVPGPPALGVGLVGASFFLTVGVSLPPGVTGRGSPVGFCAPEGFCACASATAVLAASSAAAAVIFRILLIAISFDARGKGKCKPLSTSRKRSSSRAKIARCQTLCSEYQGTRNQAALLPFMIEAELGITSHV